jgi:hypothetical protein
MKQQIYSIFVEVGDIVSAKSEAEARAILKKTYPWLPQEFLDKAKCESWDDVMKKIKSASSGKK